MLEVLLYTGRMPDVIETLITAIAKHEAALRARIPDERTAALVALVRAQDRVQGDANPTREPPFDLVHGSRLTSAGGSLALSIAFGTGRASDRDEEPFSSAPDPDTPDSAHDLDAWASSMLTACANLADARHVLAHLASGFMRGDVVEDGTHDHNPSVNVWIAQKRFPPAWRERIDLAWWESHSETAAVDDPTRPVDWQFGYLPEAVVADHPAHIWTDAVRIVRDGDATASGPIQESELRDHLAERLGLEPDAATSILSAMILDEANAAWHATVPGVASAPFVRLSPSTLMPSGVGLSTHPMLFITRELRRRDTQSWNNAAHQREAAFRHDLAATFADKRFIHAPTRIQLKRDGGTLRTDVDAAIFDRKTGTLALFELKSQDPFSATPDELIRRRDNVLAANRQLSGILDWIKRHTPDEILDRIDHQTAKRFHVQRVLPFVLARTLVHFNDGPAPDKRAAWGTWPDVLRLHDTGILGPTTANPLQALFTRLQAWPGDPPIPPATPPRTLQLDDLMVTITATRPV